MNNFDNFFGLFIFLGIILFILLIVYFVAKFLYLYWGYHFYRKSYYTLDLVNDNLMNKKKNESND